MQSSESDITIHQCLHGYDDGHQLLQASTKLPSRADQLLLNMSDMSGPNMTSGFQSYLTGYPANGTNWYAFAKTWYANEMRRPGCVWTHTLLIESADLAKIDNLRALSRLFVRPSKKHKQSNYGSPIRMGFNPVSTEDAEPLPREALFAVLSGLYETPGEPVYLIADNADEYSNLVLAIWGQQYSKLRRSFLFCTGSLANRKAIGRTFDLQVIPSHTSRQIQREVPKGVFIEAKSLPVHGPAPRWLTTAANELLFPTEDNLRPFLMLFGADASEGRIAFHQLLGLYLQISEAKANEEPLSEIIRVVTNYYPDAAHGTLLKGMLLGNARMNDRLLPSFSETDILREMAITSHHAAFNGEALKLKQRAAKLVRKAPHEAKQLILDLLDHEVGPFGEEIISGICQAVDPIDALDLAKERYGLLFVFVKYNPTLLTLPQIWQRSTDQQRELYDWIIPRFKTGDLVLKDVIWAMLEGGSDVVALELIRQCGFQVAGAVLDWFDSSKDSRLGERWESALSEAPEGMPDWLTTTPEPRAKTMAVLASLLDPNSEEVIHFGTLRWLRLAKAQADELQEHVRIRSMAFLLALSFNNPDSQAAELAAEAFQIVHDAAARQQLSYGSWRRLMYQAPSHSWWGEWDRCERLRHALVDHFIRYKWSPEFFLKAVRRAETFAEVLRTYTKKSKGGKFLHLVALDVEHGHISATKEQRDKLSFFL